MTTPEPDFARDLAAVSRRLQPVLESLLDSASLPGEIHRPARLVAAMRHAVLNGGKRFRPFLMSACADLFECRGDGVRLAAASVELVHCYSLVHDDLPAMDDDDLRRGRPTVHRAFDEATAILAGDALLTLAFDVLSRPDVHPDGGTRAELVRLLARAAGLGGMAGGQMLDLMAEGGAQRLDEAAVRRMQAMKTGALIAAACEMGAVLAGAGEEDRRRLADFGRTLGLAFQIADDLLDAEGSAEALGKATAKDAGRGKATLVALLGPARARAALDQAVEGCESALAPFGPRAAPLAAAARFAARRTH